MSHQSGGVTELDYKKRSAEIRKSAAWISMQRMLKRTGSRFVVRGARGKLANGVFDFEVVRHLYLLQLASGEINTAIGFPQWAVVGDFYTDIPTTVRLPTSHVIVPDMIRRKVYAFQQAKNLKGNEVIKRPEFSGGLYNVMKNALGSKIISDEMISTLPITREDIRDITASNMISYGLIAKSKSPPIVLLRLECLRLKMNRECALIDRCIKNISDVNLLNKLGYSLYFTFLYRDDNDLFVDFIRGFMTAGDLIKHINDFVSNVHEVYLFTAKERACLRHKKDFKI